MTKYSEEFKKEVREYYENGRLTKKYSHDKSFTFANVAKKFNLTVEQIRAIFYNKTKNSNGSRQNSEWQKPNWSKPKKQPLKNCSIKTGSFVDDPRAEEYDKYGKISFNSSIAVLTRNVLDEISDGNPVIKHTRKTASGNKKRRVPDDKLIRNRPLNRVEKLLERRVK